MELGTLNSVRPNGTRSTIILLRVLLGFLLPSSLQTTEDITPNGLISES